MPTLTSRRHFLNQTTLALSGFAVGGSSARSATAPAPSTKSSHRFTLAVVGCGGRGRAVMKNLLTSGATLVALCDVDPAQIELAQADALKVGGELTTGAKTYRDYRQLIDHAAQYDGVLIATPDHWHAPLCRAFMQRGKHIFCEKPLTHRISEARELRELARHSKVITQMGNQGSASVSLRRSVELIQAGAVGQIRDIYHWGVGVAAQEGRAPGADPVPAGFDWDMWLGPAESRPYQKEVYHPFKWRDWFDFGNGGLADICCHAMNLPVRALQLDYPTRIEVAGVNEAPLSDQASVTFRFAARGRLQPVALHWLGKNQPPPDVLAPLVSVYQDKVPNGLMIVGDEGRIYTSHWNTNGLIQLAGEPRLTDINRHAATKEIPTTLPRTPSHEQEWISACLGEGPTFSPFETGGKLTEIGLAGILALRARKNLDWDGEKMHAPNAPEVQKFIRATSRPQWRV